MKHLKFLILAMLAAVVIMAPAKPVSAAGEYDIRGAGDVSVTTSEGTAIFSEFTLEGSTGTGTFHPFLQVNKSGLGGGSHPDSPVYGYDTDLDVPDFLVTFYTTEPTYAVTLAELPVVQLVEGGTKYIEFALDSNQDKGHGGLDSLLTWDTLKIYQTNNHLINYTELSGLTPIWDLDSAGDSWILFNGQYGSGSGQGDMKILIPQSLFGGFTYVIAFVSFGGNAFGSASAHPNNDGFEEFGYVEAFLPDISITKSADIDYFCLSDAPAPVIYTYLVENTGTDDLDNVVVTDDTCSSPSYVSGDDGDGLLNPGEIWTYTCSTSLSDETTNTGTVVATGVESGIDVTDSDTATVLAYDVDVYVDPSEDTICAGSSTEFCAVPSLGSGNYTYSWTLGGEPLPDTTACIEASEEGEYCVTVTDNVYGCQATACATLTVIDIPSCSIEGSTSVCDTDVEIEYYSGSVADSYYWTISGDAVIVGDNDLDYVYVTPTGPGAFTLYLEVCNGPAELECCSTCDLGVTVNPCTPGIDIEKEASIDSFCLSDTPVSVTYTYYVQSTQEEPLVDVVVEDDTCGPLSGPTGDDGNDGILENGEIWVYECTMDLYDTTTNTVTADAVGYFSGIPVSDIASATVDAYDLYVEVDPPEATICEGSEVELCADVSEGFGNYSYLWTLDDVDIPDSDIDCITVSEAGEYCVYVLDTDTLCVASACATVTVVDPPECLIDGPYEVCADEATGITFYSTYEADTYEWSVTGDASIAGVNYEDFVTIDATGDFTVHLEVCNGPDCCSTCDLDVDFIEIPECTILGPLEVCEDDTEVLFCSVVDDADSYAWTVTGDAVIYGDDDLDCVYVNPTGPGSFNVSLEICYDGEVIECCSTCDVDVLVIDKPDCSIEGPESICEGDEAVFYTTETADAYEWSVSGNGEIVGDNTGSSVTVRALGEGTFTVYLHICNEGDAEIDGLVCCSDCNVDVDVVPCGVYCGFTQGFYGNAGGKSCGGMSTTEIINAAISNGSNPVVVGVDGRSITFDSAACIINRLPAGGPAKALPASLGDADCDSLPASLVKKNKPEINNVLVGQVVTLTLNTRLYLAIGSACNEEINDLEAFILPDAFCIMGNDGCPKQYKFPAELQGMNVADLLELANLALGGADISPVTIGQVNNAVSSINEAFDECKQIIDCPSSEICDNGCDDDFDGDVDCNDSDCSTDPACITPD